MNDEKGKKCSFCFDKPKDTEVIVAGPGYAAICGRCILLAIQQVLNFRKKKMENALKAGTVLENYLEDWSKHEVIVKESDDG